MMTTSNIDTSPPTDILEASSIENIRVASIFVIFVISFLAAFFPTAAQRIRIIKVPTLLFFVGKHFGTGVILSTAFIHLLSDAFKNLEGFRLGGYKNWPGLIILLSLLAIFLVEYTSTVYVENIASQRHHSDKPQSHSPTTTLVAQESQTYAREEEASHANDTVNPDLEDNERTSLLRRGSQRDDYFDVYMHHHDHSHNGGHCAEITQERRDTTMQLLSVLVLQLGIMLHSFVIGMTLAVTSLSHLTSLLTAILFHQLFEGLSLGVRLAGLPTSLPMKPSPTANHTSHPKSRSIRFVPTFLALLFGITTPLGIASGLLLSHFKHSATPNAPGQPSVFTGIMSGASAGLLIYAGCVELLAGDFVMDADMRKASLGRQVVAVVSLACGALAMALVG